jgi:hypothetical protein
MNKAYPHSQAHLQFAKANAQSKNCKRACLFATADFADTKKTKSFEDRKNGMTELKIYLKPFKDDKNAQLVTRYIKNWADSAKYEVFSSYLTLCGLIVNRSVMPNFSYTHPLAFIERDKPF